MAVGAKIALDAATDRTIQFFQAPQAEAKSRASADAQVDVVAQTRSRREQDFTIRVQAQGGGLEESVVVGPLHRPVKAAEAIAALHQLKASLSKPELKKREKAFQEAESWMRRVAAGGGIGTIKRSFHNPEFKRTDIRVDVEVLRGSVNLIP